MKAVMEAGLQLVAALFSWLLFGPLGLFMPRKLGRVAVIGRDEGKFVDNAKYIFIDPAAASSEVAYISEDGNIVRLLRSAGLKALRYPTLAAVWWCLRASVMVADSAEWQRRGRYQLLLGARRVQLWHGVPLKEIELSLFRHKLAGMSSWKRSLFRAYKAITGRWCRLDIVISTSTSVGEELMRPAFNARRIVATGYPRNDVLVADEVPRRVFLNTDDEVIERCKAHRASGGYVCVYAPTFRNARNGIFDDGILDRESLEDFCRANKLLFVLKLHPVVPGLAGAGDGSSRLIEYNRNADIYPLLRETDVLCTDYSSIFFDYLLLDRPLVFFAHDLARYLEEDRRFNSNYKSLVPGRVCMNQVELLAALTTVLRGRDDYAEHRRALREQVHDHFDAHAGERVWREIRNLAGSPDHADE